MRAQGKMRWWCAYLAEAARMDRLAWGDQMPWPSEDPGVRSEQRLERAVAGRDASVRHDAIAGESEYMDYRGISIYLRVLYLSLCFCSTAFALACAAVWPPLA